MFKIFINFISLEINLRFPTFNTNGACVTFWGAVDTSATLFWNLIRVSRPLQSVFCLMIWRPYETHVSSWRSNGWYRSTSETYTYIWYETLFASQKFPHKYGDDTKRWAYVKAISEKRISTSRGSVSSFTKIKWYIKQSVVEGLIDWLAVSNPDGGVVVLYFRFCVLCR
jgi:hypothetical protein